MVEPAGNLPGWLDEEIPEPTPTILPQLDPRRQGRRRRKCPIILYIIAVTPGAEDPSWVPKMHRTGVLGELEQEGSMLGKRRKKENVTTT
jgi:hypothetical protein